MPIRIRKSKVVKTKIPKPNLSVEVASLERSLEARRNEEFSKGELAQRCLILERDYADLRARLVNLLLPEQIDAARICGVTPEVYALEWINIIKDRLRTYAPAYTKPTESRYEVAPLHQLKNQGYQ